MRNVVALCATALALMTPGIAQASNFGGDGTYVFEGDVSVIKNLPFPTACTLTVTVVVSGGGSTATADPALGTSTLCNGIDSLSFAGAPFTVSAAAGIELTLAGVDIGIPPVSIFPDDACFGNLKVDWGGNGLPTPFLDLTTPKSDVPDGPPDKLLATENPCKIEGTLEQISATGTGLNIVP